MQTVLRLSLIIGFISHATYSFCQSENIETVLIKREIGESIFSSATIPTSNFRKDDEDKYKYTGMLKGMDTFQLTFKPFDVKQYYYDMLKRGKISQKDMFKRFNDDIDTLSLSKNFIKHRVGVFAGLKGKDKIVIVDSNHNFDFSDDKIYTFDTTTYFNTKWRKAFETAPVLDFNYEIYYNSRIIHRTSTFKLFNYNEATSYKDEMAKKLVVYFTTYDYYHTTLNINQKPYYIELEESPYFGVEVKNFIIPSNMIKDTSVKKENFTYQYDEKFAANGTIYSISKVSYFKDTLFLKNWGKGDYVEGNKLGMKSRPFCKQTLEDVPICLEKLKGKYVLLDFWGTWCKPCIASIPDLKKIRDAFSPNDLEIISIAADNKLDKVKEFVKERNMNWTHLQQAQNAKEADAMTAIFMVNAFPTTILIDKNGLIVERGAGSDFVESLYEKLKTILK